MADGLLESGAELVDDGTVDGNGDTGPILTAVTTSLTRLILA